MQDYNQWAKEMNVGAYYVPPTPPASGHYFNASVYKMKKQKLGIMKRLLKLLGFFLFTLIMSSCTRYVNSGGGGCGVWHPKKFEKFKVFPTRSHPMYRMGVH
jgi:hypothetical protein